MPVFAIPKFKAAGPAADCDQQAEKAPETTRVLGCEVPARRKALEVYQGQLATIDWTMLDQSGKSVDLSSCGTFVDGDSTTGSVKLRIREACLLPSCSTTIEITGTVADPTTGVVQFVLTTDATKLSGVFMAEAAVYNTDSQLIFVNQFSVIVTPTLAGSDPQQVNGMPPISEIRLHLRDSDPGENRLLANVQFDSAEIAFAILRPILYWNEAPPPVDRKHTTTNFPYRSNWLDGIVAQLYIMAAHWYRRNRAMLQSQGGLGVDDLNKAQEYEQIGESRWAEYQKWVQWKKVQFNAQSAVQSTGSAYGWVAGYYGW